MKVYKALVNAEPDNNRPAVTEKLPLFSEKQRDKIAGQLPATRKMKFPVAIISKTDDRRYRFHGFVENDDFDEAIVKVVISELKKSDIKKPVIYVSAFSSKKIKKALKHKMMLKNIKGKVKDFPKTDEWTVTIYIS